MTRLTIAAFIAAVILYFVSLYVYIPILPAFVAGRTSTLAAVGIVLAMYGLCTAILRMPMGIAADATGRSRPFIVLGALMAGAGAVVIVAGRSLGTLALGRAFTGVAAAAWVPMMAVFAGYFAPRQAIFATSLLSLASSLGQMIGTGSTGLVESLGGYGLTFVVAAGFSILASLIFLIVKIPRSAERRTEPLSGRSILAVARRRDVIVPSLTNALCQFGVWALTFGFMPLLATRMGAGAGATGLIMTLNIAANTAANLFATLIANRGHRRLLLYLSFAVFAGGAMLAAFGATLGFLFVSTVLMGLANGLFFPILLGLSIQRVDTAHRSTAMGIHQAVYAVGMFTGPWVGGIVADAVGIRAMFAIVAAFSFVGPGSLFLLYRDPPVEG
ncbi:MAG TPA: MFS transporter [Rectinemataceae bacterium]|nr:MFS transporter [Rectinemataceae bacterium]